MDNQDKQALDQAGYLLELMETKGYREFLLPFLLNLAQEGYPDPLEYSKLPQPQQALQLDYTRKVGETSAVKKVLDYLNGQVGVKERILTKNKNKKDYNIGDGGESDVQTK